MAFPLLDRQQQRFHERRTEAKRFLVRCCVLCIDLFHDCIAPQQ